MNRFGSVLGTFAAGTLFLSAALAPSPVAAQSPKPSPDADRSPSIPPPADTARFYPHPYNPWDSYIFEPWNSYTYPVGGGLYPYSYRFNRRELHASFRTGRATERYRQNVFELRQKLNQRLRYRRGSRDPAQEPDRTYLDIPRDPRPRHRQVAVETADPYPYDGYQYTSPVGESYDQGRQLERYRQEELYLREQLTLLSYSDLFDHGLEMFRAGRYGQAARLFTAAADANHEDAASRIHAAQSLLAVGQYDEALIHVHRAFELAPQLLNMPLDLAADYNDHNDYRQQLAALETHVRDHPTDTRAAVLLAYARFFSPRPTDAAADMARIKPLAQRDPFVRKLLRAAAPIIPQAR